MAEPKMKGVAPDGGWGWVIVGCFACSNVITIPIFQVFGLLFRNVFVELDLSATDVSTIININSGFGFMLGLMNAPLLRTYGFRKHALIGSVFMFIGFLLTSQATSFTQLVIFYGLINSTGLTMHMSSFNLALNTYFRKRRSRAAGIQTTLTGLGSVFMPLLVSKSISYYGSRGTALILAGMLLHSFAVSLLLHPIKWHYKYVLDEDDPGKEMVLLNQPKEDEANEEDDDEKDDEINSLMVHCGYGVEDMVLSPRRVSDVSARRDISRSKLSLYDKDTVIEPNSTWWKSNGNKENLKTRRESTAPSVKSKKEKQSCLQRFVVFFGFDLLKDPIYRNIWIGMSMALCGEISFSLLTPIILGDRKFGIEETARIMSTIATADIIFRFTSPFIGDRMKIPPRQMYMISLAMLVVSRFCLTLVHSYWATLMVGLGLGVAKGFRTVYMTLVVPNYVPLEKLASAQSLQALLNGVMMFSFGPVLGFVRDYFGDYNMCIHVINLLTIGTLTIWSIEFFLRYRRASQRQQRPT